MQVHKDTIDKVPNSLPNRGNIEIEIYGMEGIPDADVKEHERQKGGAPLKKLSCATFQSVMNAKLSEQRPAMWTGY